MLISQQPNDSRKLLSEEQVTKETLVATTPVDPRARPYKTVLNDVESKGLNYLLSTLANSSYASLLWNRKKLEKAGKILESIHPLTFMQVVSLDSNHKKNLLKIKKVGGIIWDGTQSQVAKSIEQERSYRNLMPHLEEFAERLNLDLAEIRELILKGQYSSLIEAITKES